MMLRKLFISFAPGLIATSAGFAQSKTQQIDNLVALEGRAKTPAKKFAPAILDTYLGEYRLGPNSTITVTREGSKLITTATEYGKEELEHASSEKFKVPSIGAIVVFQKDASGKVIGLVLKQRGQTLTAKKIK